MSQEHLKSDERASLVAPGELGKDFHDLLFQEKCAAFVQDHAGSGRCQYLGQGCQVVDRLRRDLWSFGLVGEVAATLEGHQPSAIDYGDGGARERRLSDRGVEYRERALETCVLVGEI